MNINKRGLVAWIKIGSFKFGKSLFNDIKGVANRLDGSVHRC